MRLFLALIAILLVGSVPSRAGTRFGVDFSGEGPFHNHPEIVVATRASWVRLNLNLTASDQDYVPFLAAGLNVVLTIVNRDPSNIDVTYGTVQQWPQAGFPYLSRTAYQERIRTLLSPALPYLAGGRQVEVQCENEAGDVQFNTSSTFWRGDTTQYLAQLSALYDAVRTLSSSLVVVMTSFASESLEAVINPLDPRYLAITTRFARMLSEGRYDAADLHFYDCVESIPAKVAWVTAHLPAGRVWISTENGGPDYTCASTPLKYAHNPSAFEESEAAQVPQRLTSCSDNGGTVCLWFSLLDLKGESEVFSHLGLLDQATSPPRQKPAYEAFRSFVGSQATARRRAVSR